MRYVLAFLLLGACASPSPARVPTAADFIAAFQPQIVTPTPTVLKRGFDIPLAAGDQIIANCADVYVNELGEMTPEERLEFDAGVVCVYPQPEQFEASYRHYANALRARGFEDESGTYVQSGVRISCNQTHSVIVRPQGQFIPRSIMTNTGEFVDIEGGGVLANMVILFSVSERPCERHTRAVKFSEPAAPDDYRDQPMPNFLDPVTRITWGDYEFRIRPEDRLVAHCAQYYREETQSLPRNPTPADFAELNQRTYCIYVPQDAFNKAAAHYLAQLSVDGFAGVARRDEPDPAQSTSGSKAGARDWYGQITRCGKMNSVILGAMARHGKGTLMDVATGEFWTKLTPTGGRGEKQTGASYPGRIITVRFIGGGCDQN